MALDAILFVTPGVFEEAKKPQSLSAAKMVDNPLIERFLNEGNSIKALLLWLENCECSSIARDRNTVIPLLLKAISEIDRKIEQQLNTILHHDEFQALEASWRSIAYVVEQKEQCDKDQKIKIKLLDCSWTVLSKDIAKAIEFDQSEYFKLIYNNEFDMSGGEPFGVIIGDYQVTHKSRPGLRTNDVDTLKEIARTSAAAFSPFITSVEPSLFGVDNFCELGNHLDISAIFEQLEYTRWNSLRDMDDSRFIGLTLPQVLMRSPYKIDGTRSEGFKFSETVSNPNEDYLWGNAAYAFAGVLIRAFSDSGWFGQIRGMEPGQRSKGLVCDLPVCQYETDIYRKRSKPSVDLLVSDRNEKMLSDLGFIPLSSVSGCEHHVFYSNASLQKPPVYDSVSATINSKLSSMLQYIFCVSRFAHYIKVLGREKAGSFSSAQALQNDIHQWLLQYTTESESISGDLRSKYPLNNASVQVKEISGKPGCYYSIIQLQPHFQLDQMVSSIRLVTELTSRNK